MDNFSNLMMIGECLLDEKRTNLFKKAIEKTVREGDIVLDAGTGSGILALFAARAGAAKVYAVEIDQELAKIAQDNARANGLSSVIEVKIGNLKEMKLPPFNVAIIEMLDTGLVAEQQIPVINSLIAHKSITNSTKIIPSMCQIYIQFSEFNFHFYSQEMPFIIQARNNAVRRRIKEKISRRIQIEKVLFDNKIDSTLSKKSTFIAKKTGLINSFIMETKLTLSEGIKTWGTTDMNMPVIVPVPQKLVKEGERITFSINYEISQGFNQINFEWIDYA